MERAGHTNASLHLQDLGKAQADVITQAWNSTGGEGEAGGSRSAWNAKTLSQNLRETEMGGGRKKEGSGI